jgi:hypothetical protein
MTDALGKISFLEVPTVNGTDVLLNAGGVPAILSGITSARPTAGTGIVGRLYLDTTTSTFYRDNGASWDALGSSSSSSISGTANEITVVPGTNVTPSVISLADNSILPGTAGFMMPSGTTAERPISPTPGTTRFNTTLGSAEIYQSGIWMPHGRIIQTVIGNIPASSGNNTIPWDNTLPLITEGREIWTQSFTPLSASSTITVKFGLTLGTSNTNRVMIVTVFAGSVCIGSSGTNTTSTANNPTSMFMDLAYVPGSTAPITISARIGASSSTTVYVNQTGTATLGGTLVSDFIIMEII